MIAALFVETDGAYFGITEIDPWDEIRDARRVYADPHGALDEASDLIGDALTDIQAVLTVEASCGCTCDQCAEKDINKDTML